MARKLKGIAAAPGIAIAPVVHFHTTLDQIPTRQIADEHVAAEKARLVGAIETVTENLTELQKELAGALGKHDVRIYDAQLAILHDKTFIKEVEGEIDERKCNLEVALQRVVARYESAFEQMENVAMRERAADLRDIGRQLVGALVARGRQIYTADGADYLFAADEFLPSDAGILDREHIRGIVTTHGGKYSHGAILARSLGIPAIVGVDNVMQETSNGALAVLDGDAGVVVLDPSPDELAEYERRLAEQRSVESRISELRFQPSVTPDGTKVRLQANAEGVQDLAGLELDAIAGIGLFRTEFAFMERRQFPTEDEQVAMYSRAVESAGGKPVTFRTLDVGGDKPLGYFQMPEERNPVLGWRGIRLCLDWPDILYTQLRAILRASAEGHVRILLPMITTRSEVVRCREVLDQLTADLRKNGVPFDARIELGVMVEVPVLVSVLPEILPVVDFVSVGTNDLVQYLLAVDRDNQRVAKMYDPFHPGVLRVLAQIAELVAAAGKSASICGEVAGDHWFTPLLLGMGYRELSMAPVFLPRVKLMLRSFSIDECRDLTRRALALHSATAVRKMIHSDVLPRWGEQLRGSGGDGASAAGSV
ncbi:MAG: phosphoenolpyruvate--protein phosphotransferase [Planctomycetota bacterium]|nr:phosphoenolpyruvate--protein phosphotransferase [Planctomycetota bacterium]MEC9047845.1 phosphoenolpyruvate--protein phosphotransferase [Planctomycetota bacterium]